MLAKVIEEKQTDWDMRLPAVLAAYRASRHEATGFSPPFSTTSDPSSPPSPPPNKA